MRLGFAWQSLFRYHPSCSVAISHERTHHLTPGRAKALRSPKLRQTKAARLCSTASALNAASTARCSQLRLVAAVTLPSIPLPWPKSPVACHPPILLCSQFFGLTVRSSHRLKTSRPSLRGEPPPPSFLSATLCHFLTKAGPPLITQSSGAALSNLDSRRHHPRRNPPTATHLTPWREKWCCTNWWCSEMAVWERQP